MTQGSHRLKQAKRALRREVLAARDALTAEERAARSEAITRRLLALPEMRNAHTALVFWSFGSEVDTGTLIDRLLAGGARVALPRVAGSEVEPAGYVRGDPLRGTNFGAMEPEGGSQLDPSDLDLVVVPGVAFDREGNRVGYGGGFYDRLLPRLRSTARSMGVAFAVQIVQTVPTGGSDRRVDVIVTEDEVIRPTAPDLGA